MEMIINQIGETIIGRIEKAKLTPIENEIRKYILNELNIL